MAAFGLAVVGIKYLIVSRIKLIQAKLERAEKHIADIDTAIRLFFKSNPYVIVARQDQQTGDYISYVESVRDVPADVSLIEGMRFTTPGALLTTWHGSLSRPLEALQGHLPLSRFSTLPRNMNPGASEK